MEHTLLPDDRARADEHLAACESCRAAIAEAAIALVDTNMAGELDGVAEGPAPGTRVERYVLGAPLGAGGAGVVFAARDPELQRDVAIKLVRPQWRMAGSGGRLQERVRREGQAMARLRHPNVVAVFDVGEWEDRVFIAMELIAGVTLRAWLQATPRSWREVLAVFLGAGEGLAAAHAAGIVHRDFKPANVLVGDDGRVCVTDFGLAATGPVRRPEAPSAPTATDPSLTHTGALLGTPRYMAPEQFSGGRVDARTDVFAFAVALFEALHGEPPFRGDTVVELARVVGAGEVAEPRGRSRVPGWLRRAVARGLRPRREDRHPSMRAFLSVLARDRGRKVRRGLLVAGVTAAALAGAALLAPARAAPCTAGPRELARTFGPSRRAALSAGLLASGARDAPALAARTLGAVDAYGTRWTEAYQEACEATQLRGEQSQELLDVRMDCLAQQLRGLSALADLLAHADAASAGHALDAVLAIDRLHDCAEPATLIGPLRPRPEIRAHPDIAAARLLLGRAQALGELSRTAEGIEAANAGLVAARRQGYRALEAELLFARGYNEEMGGAYPSALRTLAEAVWTGEEAHDDAAVLRAATLLANVACLDVADLATADQWAGLARAKLVRLGAPPGPEADTRRMLGNLAIEHGHPAEAEMEYRRALAVSVQISGHDTMIAAELLSGLGSSLARQDRVPEGVSALRESLATFERLYGRDHVNVTNPLQNLGWLLVRRGRAAEGLPLLERAVELRRAALGDRHPDTLRTAQNHAAALARLGRLPEALAEQRFVVAAREEVLGRSNEITVNSRILLARLLRQGGDVEAALAMYREAHDAAPPASASLAEVATVEAMRVLIARGRIAEAVPWAQRWLALVARRN